MFSGNWYIFGAKSIAIDIIRALSLCHHECHIMGVIVSSKQDNPEYVEGYKVEELKSLSQRLTESEKKETNILLATTIYLHGEIRGTLRNFGFSNIMELDSVTEAELMRQYYTAIGVYSSVKNIDTVADGSGMDVPKTTVLEVRHYTDQPLKHKCNNPQWVYGFQAGLLDGKAPMNVNGSVSKYFDETGENIAEKNSYYCELSAYYWVWKNFTDDDSEYVGVSRYGRYLDVDLKDLANCKKYGIDVVLPYPMINMPDVCDYHSRYISDEEWNALLQVLEEMEPEYFRDIERIWKSQYMYKFNMLIATKKVFDDYCDWLFPILFKVEKVIADKGITTSKRYMAFLGECLLTLYFMHNAYRLNIKHTGRMLRI